MGAGVDSPSSFDALETTSNEEEQRVIAGFWTRLLAFVIDSLILGILGFLLGLIFFDTFASLGGWGRLVGFSIGLFYFGILNSSLGNGQTVGKRIVRIKLADRNGQLISLNRSFVRYTILSLPFFLNGLMLPPSLMVSDLAHIIGAIIFGVGGSIIYLFVFNRKTRQSLHDLAVDSFVLRESASGPAVRSKTWRYHYAVVGVWCLINLAFAVIVSPMLTSSRLFSDLSTVQNSIQATGNVHMSTLFVGTSWDTNGETRYFATNAIWKHKPPSPEAAAEEVASIILRDYPDISNQDILAINVTYGYDIGIASSWQSYSVYHSPIAWTEKLRE